MTPKQVRASLVEEARKAEVHLKELYKNKLKDGWTLGQIDEMDIHFYFSLFKEETVYIDQIQLF